MSKRKRCCYVAWDEQIVCAERGNRLVHFHLKDGFGNSMLAVVGTERSIRHMLYVATDELLQAYGSGGLINGNKQWRARREVVALLASLVSNTEMDDSKDDLASLKVNVPRTVKPQRSEIIWSGEGWFCAKQLKHYPSFSIHGVKIAVHSFVSILTEESGYYIGYLEDLYEDKKGVEKVRVRWFLNDLNDQRIVSQLKPHREEVLITPYVQVISAKCVVGQATVLTPSDYEKLSAFAMQTSPAGILMCYRQVKDNKITPFALPKLRGYLNQAVFSFLYRNYLICKANLKCSELSMEDEEDRACDDNTLRDGSDNEKYRNWKVIQGYGFQDFRTSISHSPAAKCRPAHPGLKFKLSKIMNKQFPRSEARVSFSSEINQKIELLCEDSGIRGCWFRCQILQRSEKRFQVMYNDLLDADESGNLEEWVLAVKLATSDKLGIRCTGRNTIRPPPPKDVVNSKFEVGMPVDAWWCDGWWEGVVTHIDSCQLNNLVIYFPGEDKLMRFQRKYVRRSRDWVGNRWVDLKPKPEIVTFLAANACKSIKPSLCSVVGSPREETPSILNKDVLAPSNEGFSNSSKNSTIIDETRYDEGDNSACFATAPES